MDKEEILKHIDEAEKLERQEDELDIFEEVLDDKSDEDKILPPVDIDDDEEREPTEEEKIVQEKIQRVKKKLSLEGKMERKSALDHNLIEAEIVKLLKEYDINKRINDYVDQQLGFLKDPARAPEIIEHVNNPSSNKLLFDVDVFYKIDEFVKIVVREALNKEMQSERYKTDAEYREILSTIDTHIDLTLSKYGIDKLTLVAYHYFIKYLETVAKDFIDQYQDYLVDYNKQKTATTLYHREVMNILSNHKQMHAFTSTIVSLTASWLEKYRQKSAKLGQFIMDLTLSTNDVMVDKIARYILLIALKNKNPILLRSIFSTFLSLIHRNIASLMSVSLTNVKVGYFKAMTHMFEDEENSKIVKNRHLMLAKSLVRILKKRNRMRHKQNAVLQKIFQPLIDPNITDFMYFATGEHSSLDEFQLYVMYGRYIVNSDDNEKANALRVKSDIRACKSTNSIKKYLDLKVKQRIYDPIMQFYKDEEAAGYIVTKIKTDILKELDPLCYVSTDGDVIMNDVNSMYDEIDVYVETISEFLERG